MTTSRRRPLPAGRLPYDETPDPVSPGRATLDGFLFETKSGYCQHFSAAMAILLRMGGVPARVVTGFSPGGYSQRKHAWIVRDTDAHSWVEAWFDEFGWVTFDPDPGCHAGAVADRGARAPAGDRPGRRRRRRTSSAARPRAAAASARTCSASSPGRPAAAVPDAGGGPPWWWIAVPAVLLVALAGWLVQRWRRRSMSPAAALDRAIAELEAALRRHRPAGPQGLTLAAARAAAGPLARGGRLPARAARRPLRADRRRADPARPPRAAPRARERRGRAGTPAERSGRCRPGGREHGGSTAAREGRFTRRARTRGSTGERGAARLLAHLGQDPLEPGLRGRVHVRHRGGDGRMAFGDQRVHLVRDRAVGRVALAARAQLDRCIASRAFRSST